MNRKRGFTLIELLVVIAIIALLIGLLLPALAKAKRNAASLKDKAQLKQIHQAMLTFANDNKDVLPTPGLINRKADIYTGDDRPGSGPENYNKNVSMALYSALIAQEFFNTDIVIGPTEVNPIVEQFTDYDYSNYNPGNDTYWDGDKPGNQGLETNRFAADIQGSQAGYSNTSYYHLALVGLRKKLKWRNSADNSDPLLSSRAPWRGRGETGGGDAAEYANSQTLLLHGPKKSWVGNVCYGDNHTEVSETFLPALVSYEPQGGQLEKDNIFDMEFQDPTPAKAGDAFLCMTRACTDTIITDFHETLLP